MKIAIVDYGAGNTQSVIYAFNRIGITPLLTKDPEEINASNGLIFPGVGHATHALKSLGESGLIDCIKTYKKPLFGICLGMQLLCESTEEGECEGFNLIDGKVERFTGEINIPQIGWNSVRFSENQLFDQVRNGSYFYFVHSYYLGSSQNRIASADYNGEFTAAVQKDNLYAVQFHPEKSGEVGQKILKNFIKICESYQQ